MIRMFYDLMHVHKSAPVKLSSLGTDLDTLPYGEIKACEDAGVGIRCPSEGVTVMPCVSRLYSEESIERCGRFSDRYHLVSVEGEGSYLLSQVETEDGFAYGSITELSDEDADHIRSLVLENGVVDLDDDFISPDAQDTNPLHNLCYECESKHEPEVLFPLEMSDFSNFECFKKPLFEADICPYSDNFEFLRADLLQVDIPDDIMSRISASDETHMDVIMPTAGVAFYDVGRRYFDEGDFGETLSNSGSYQFYLVDKFDTGDKYFVTMDENRYGDKALVSWKPVSDTTFNEALSFFEENGRYVNRLKHNALNKLVGTDMNRDDYVVVGRDVLEEGIAGISREMFEIMEESDVPLSRRDFSIIEVDSVDSYDLYDDDKIKETGDFGE